MPTIERAIYLEVDAGVRYWDDASINGKRDDAGNIPLRRDDAWHLIIELETGRILDWPTGVEAQTCYKVCDAGLYWLMDADKARIAKWRRAYVPARFLDQGDEGIVSDYIVMEIGPDGAIKDWHIPIIDPEHWTSA